MCHDKGETVLVVEDDPDLREDLAYILEKEGYKVRTAQNGKEALECMREGCEPCLVVLDLMMPVMDGWQLRAEMKADEALSHIPFVLVSGVADLSWEAQNLGATHYFSKPVDLDGLFECVQTHCA